MLLLWSFIPGSWGPEHVQKFTVARKTVFSGVAAGFAISVSVAGVLCCSRWVAISLSVAGVLCRSRWVAISVSVASVLCRSRWVAISVHECAEAQLQSACQDF